MNYRLTAAAHDGDVDLHRALLTVANNPWVYHYFFRSPLATASITNRLHFVRGTKDLCAKEKNDSGLWHRLYENVYLNHAIC